MIFSPPVGSLLHSPLSLFSFLPAKLSPNSLFESSVNLPGNLGIMISSSLLHDCWLLIGLFNLGMAGNSL